MNPASHLPRAPLRRTSKRRRRWSRRVVATLPIQVEVILPDRAGCDCEVRDEIAVAGVGRRGVVADAGTWYPARRPVGTEDVHADLMTVDDSPIWRRR